MATTTQRIDALTAKLTKEISDRKAADAALAARIAALEVPPVTIPIISDFTVKSITSTSAVASWSTDIPAGGKVRYRKKGEPVSAALFTTPEPEPGLGHIQPIIGLQPGTTYIAEAIALT